MASHTRSRLVDVLAAVALTAWAAGLVVRASGGFILGPLSVRSPRPLMGAAAMLTCGALIVLGRRGVAAWVDRAWSPRARWPAWAVLAMAAVVVVASAGAGSQVAGGADSSGYLSQARLWLEGGLTRRHALADQLRPSVGAWAFAPLGYRPGSEPGTVVPIYPAGYPLTLAAAHTLGGARAAFLVVPLLGGLLVWLAYRLGCLVTDRRGGLVAAVLLASSPTFLYQVMQPMSDVPAAAWWALAALGCLRGSPRALLAGGIAASMAVLTRPNLVPLALVLAVFVAARRDEGQRSAAASLRRAAIFVIAVIPGCAIVGFLNHALYGSPLLSGYGPADYLYDRGNVWTNLHRYTAWLWQSHTRLIWLAALGVVPGVLRPVRGADSGPLWLAMVMPLVVLALYLAYIVFADATYLRFLLPGMPFLFAAAGGVVIALAARLPRPLGLMLTLAATAMAANGNVAEARRIHAFDVERLERRYLTAGRHVASLPADGIIVLARQHSGSLAYYTRAPILRWSLLDGEGLDATLALASRQRRRVLIVVDEVEIADFRSRFGGHAPVGDLDWPPRARTVPPDDTRVYDLTDRAPWLTGIPVELTWIDAGRRRRAP